MEKHILNIDGYSLEAGERIEGFHIAYHCSKGGYRPGMKVVWLCHGLTANSDPTDWWPQLAGEGKLLDPSKYFIVCANLLGSPYGSSCPTDIDPVTGKQYLLDFPKITLRDTARCTLAIAEHLGIEKIDLLLGASIGGFLALEMALEKPEIISQLVLLATDSRTPAYLTAYNEAQRMAMEADRTFTEAASADAGKAGLEAARAIALISYRSHEGYALTQTDEDPDTMFATRACSYERYQGRKLSNRFDAYSYWSLTHCLDSHNIGRGRGGVDAALESMRMPVTVICVGSDNLFPPKSMKHIAEHIKGAVYHQIESQFGHDGFLLESEALATIIAPLL